jgi:hypothetical protein
MLVRAFLFFKKEGKMKRTLSAKLNLIVFIMTLLTMYAPCAYAGIWTPMVSGTTNNLSSVWGSSGTDVFAVGGTGTILHYDGSTWSPMTSGTTNNLSSVWGSSGTDVFAVGNFGTILHYNGSAWSAMISGTTNNLSSVWGSSGTDVFAVGNFGTILHYNGSAWSAMISGTMVSLTGVWGTASSDVFAVGGFNCGYPDACSLILFFNGISWANSTWRGCGYPCADYFNNIWGSSSTDVFAIGYFAVKPSVCRECYLFNGSLIAHYDGTQWQRDEGEKIQFYGIWGSSGSDVFVVGTNGSIRHYEGSTWSPMSSGTTNRLNSVWGCSSNDVFAVGENGTILHYDGTVTTTTTVPPTTTISTTTTVPPTVVSLIDFNAIPGNRIVTLGWSTASEIDNAGFNIYRTENENGNYTKINSTLIPAQGSSTQGASYEFTDNDVQNRKAYFYKLEDIDLNGTATMHGPVSATPRLIYGIGK